MLAYLQKKRKKKMNENTLPDHLTGPPQSGNISFFTIPISRVANNVNSVI